MCTNLTVNSFGTKRWTNSNGYPHRIDGPAVEYLNGDKEWKVNGKLHRIGGPALQYAFTYGLEEWWVDGKLHNSTGPAVVNYITGVNEWWIDGEKVLEDNPIFQELVKSAII